MEFNKDFLGKLFEQATMNPRLRQSFDLRTSSADTSQRILNAYFLVRLCLSTGMRTRQKQLSACVENWTK